MKRCRLSTITAIKVYNYRGVMKKNTNIGIYVRYSKNMDTWKMSEKSLKTIDITANKCTGTCIIHSRHAVRLSRIASGPGKGNYMQDKKQKKAKIQVIFLILISTLVILADFYAIINYPKEYMLIAAITVIFMICLWGVISGFFSLSALKEDRREEQYDSIFKSEKASYLMLRKYFDEIEGKIEILQKESKIPTEDIINAQKGIAKVVINRNKENADAIMNSNEQLMETFEHLENKLKESNDFIIESQKNVIYDNLKDIMEKQQVLSDSIKDMEIRLSQAITANPIQFTANVEMPKQTNDAPQSAPTMEAIPEPVVEEAAIAEPEPVAVIEPEPVVETPHVPEPEHVSEAPHVPEPESEVEPSPVAEEAVADTTNSDPNRQLSADEIAALFASANAGATEPESDPAEKVITEPVTEAPQVPEPEPASEPEPAKSPVVDLNNTNRNLTPDEIAALFSSM